MAAAVALAAGAPAPDDGGEHSLQHAYQFSFLLNSGQVDAGVDYDERIHPMATVATVRARAEALGAPFARAYLARPAHGRAGGAVLAGV
jgi:hypothetical protein